MTEFNWVTGLLGGLLIGTSATVLLAFNGRIAGISGTLNSALNLASGEVWRWLFLGGLLAGGALYEYVLAPAPTPASEFAPLAMIAGGFLVGFGTRMGNGCTSGHGVCGLGRLSLRSLVAVLTFLGTAIVTVFVTRHVLFLST
ncbi:YeeE/YedE family protein [Kamptonema formosum]|uniref:YeeE/YedE family protein n=1 Tax=Kamptonema formosum TaxID=331992 RepID=UPI00034B2F1A|nr:YeeE/YedE thiosulfate transporter family protein [Oscillatoria sp. PCC 10802]